MLESKNIKIEELAVLVKSKRGKKGLRAAATESGVSPSTLSRVEQGKIPDLQTLMKLCDWLNISVNEFIREEEENKESESIIKNINTTSMDTPSIIAAHLRADKELTIETANALAEMVRVAYYTFTQKDISNEKRI